MKIFKFYLALLFLLSIVKISSGQNPTIGAIRWDAWVGDLNTDGVGAAYVGLQVERSLGPNKYHFRLPFYGIEMGIDKVQARSLTPTIMNQEIAYATDAGIDYWAFVYYPDNSGMDSARVLYDGSHNKNNVKYCYVLGASSAPSFTWLVTKFSETNYQKVLTSRPLLYIFGGASGYTASMITNLRNLTTAAGLGSPYIVVMDANSSNASSALASIGADAISAYVKTGSGGGSYASLVSAENTNWDSHKDTGRKVVPWVTSGWDTRPRYDNPVSWGTVGVDNWVQTATAIEIADHLSDGINWVGNYPLSADANTVLIYAWNEFDEGGWICPTLYNGTDRLDAIKNVTSPPSTPNLTLDKTYNSSSNWDASQNASKAFDGINITNWQASDGSPYNEQWLQVNFGAVTTFDRIKLSEYGDRTSGYRIEYSADGTNWETAFTGTIIGDSRSVKFTAVTGNYARVYFTSGTYRPIIYEFEIYNTYANLGLNKTYSSSSNWNTLQCPYKAFDANYSTNWQAKNGSTFSGQWLQVNFGTTTTFDYVKLSEYGDRTSAYRIEYSLNGTTWNTAYFGTVIGSGKEIGFTPVTGNYARIYFTSGIYTPIIYEFEIYNSSSLKSTKGKVAFSEDIFLEKVLFEVYPNPAVNKAILRYNLSLSETTFIRIYNIEGSLLRSFILPRNVGGIRNYQINTSEFKPGVYVIKCLNTKFSKSIKLIVSKSG